jgi:serine/threonine protein kinase
MIAPGTLLQNRYLVESQIGQGGMGAVFVATDQRFGSRVALKETFFTDANLRRAFEREARLLNRLRHPALPRVSDHFGEDEGQFLVMEYIPGEDLSETLKRTGGPFPARDVLAWADQLLDALDYLHTQEPSVIHRDIKPQNLKLLPGNRTNQVVLLDFGLAKGTPLQTRVTATGSLFGYSFNYAPIEQMQGAGTDPRSDLYSLGATLYHLLTGATPPDALTRATAVLNAEPDPLRPASELQEQVPVEVAAVLERAMAQSAARRFSSAAEMREALRLAGEHVGDTAFAARTDAPTVINSEQETRLLGLSSRPGAAATSPNAARAEETGVATPGEGATLVEEAAAPTSKASDAARTTGAAGADATRADALVGESDSVMTRVAPQAYTTTTPPGRSGSRLALGVAAGVFALALVGVGVLSLTGVFDGPVATPVEPQTLRQPQVQPTTEPAPAVPAPSETQQAEVPTPEPVASPDAARRATSVTTTAKGSKPRAEDAHPDAPAHAREPTAPLPATDAAADPAAPRRPVLPGREGVNRPMTQEEIQELIRQSNEQRRRARLMRQRILREGRRRPQGYDPPPPPNRPRQP